MYKEIEQHYIDNRRMLVKVMTNRAGSVENAEDVVQEAFARALRYRNSFSVYKHDLRAWINGILNNTLHDFKIGERRMGMSTEYREDMDEPCPLMDWEDDMIEAAKADIECKPVLVRQALHLYFFKGYKPREIAQVVEMSNGYIRTSVKEFKQQCRKKYGSIL